jgi:hypothetical protein
VTPHWVTLWYEGPRDKGGAKGKSTGSNISLVLQGRGQVAMSRLYCRGEGGGSDVTLVEGVDRVKGGGRAPRTLSNLGRKHHHDGMYARKWPSPVMYMYSPEPVLGTFRFSSSLLLSL